MSQSNAASGSLEAGSMVLDIMKSVSENKEPGPNWVSQKLKKVQGAGCKRSEGIGGNKIMKCTAEENKKVYQCSYCEKCISSSGNLKIHQRIHTGEKPYKCSCCDRRFAQLSQMKQHQRVHTGERPYKCFCGKYFRQLCHLQQHRRCHAGEKPFLCDQCGDGTSFVQLSQLRQHVNNHHCGTEMPLGVRRMAKDQHIGNGKNISQTTYRPKDMYVNDITDKIKLESDGVKVELTL